MTSVAKPWLWAAVSALGLVPVMVMACSRPNLSLAPTDSLENRWTISPFTFDVAPTLRQYRSEPSLFAAYDAVEQEARECRAAIISASGEPALPGAPGLENNRELLLARAKAEPVVFVETPAFTGLVSKGVQARRQALLSSKYPAEMVRQTLATFRDHPIRLRELLLRDGYLYTDDPRAARDLTTRLGFESLFTEDRLELMRGSAHYRLQKGKAGLYYHVDGPQEGQRARLLLFDRVWIEGQDPGEPLHLDVRELAQKEGVEGLQIAHMSIEHVVSDLKFGERWVPALLDRKGPNLRINCLLIEPHEVNLVGRARDEAYRRSLVLHSLRRAIAQQVQAGLPFDEPRTEYGQQDGKLRGHWERAYLAGRNTYRFNGDTYRVFDDHGEPLTPQVCIDFITETIERASGMHYTRQGAPPERLMGALNFDELLDGHRRQEMSLRNYARANPHRLSMLDVPQRDWVRYEDVDKFFAFIIKNKHELRAGDIVIIRGRAAWDHYAEVHTHTFFVYESDPVTGMPILLAGNSGKPRIVTWDDEMLRAPKRSIRHRIRANMEWLHDHVVLRTPLRGERWAAPLSLAER